MHLSSDPVSDKIPYDSVSSALAVITDRIGDLMKVMACPGIFQSLEKACLRHFDQFLLCLTDLSYGICSGSIRVITVQDEPAVQRDDISLLQDPGLARDPMYDLFIY